VVRFGRLVVFKVKGLMVMGGRAGNEAVLGC